MHHGRRIESVMDMRKAHKVVQIMQKFYKSTVNLKNIIEIPRSEFMMLKLIKSHSDENEGITVSMISELMEISKPAVSQMINVLEEKGYVERVTTKKDRRVVHVRLTEKGEKCLKKAMDSYMKNISVIFEKMGEDDAAEFLRLLEKFYQIASGYAKRDEELK